MNKLLLTRTPRCLSRLWLAGLLAVFGASLAARAALIIDLPELTLQPNQANQVFTFSVQNDGALELLTGVQLDLIVGDGDIAIGGSGGAPAFQGLTLLALGSLFAGNNNGDLGAGNFGGLQQVFQRSTSTASGTVALNPGTFDLATVTFDTADVDPGVYTWSAASSPNGVSFFTDTSPGGVSNPTLFDGTLTVVPEPVNVALSIVGGLAVLVGGWRRWCLRRTGAAAPQPIASLTFNSFPESGHCSLEFAGTGFVDDVGEEIRIPCCSTAPSPFLLSHQRPKHPRGGHCRDSDFCGMPHSSPATHDSQRHRPQDDPFALNGGVKQ